MKTIMVITLFAAVISLLGSCSGDRVPHKGKDTVKNTYGVAKDTAKMDTGKH